MKPSIHISPSHWALVALLLVAGLLQAQTVRWQGTVREQGTGEPVVSAQVHVVGRAIGAITDAEGKFSLTVTGSASALEVTHIGYKRQVVQLADREGKALDIRMEVAGGMAPVLITAGPDRIFEDKTVHLYDYELMDDKLMTIIYDRGLRRSKLAILNEKDSILAMELLPEEPGKLVKDCLGNVHAITKHLACQVFWDGEGIGYYVDSLATFERVVSPCLGNIEGNYYYADTMMDGQIIDFKFYDMEAAQWTNFLHLVDKVRIHQLMDPLDRYVTVASSSLAMDPNANELWRRVHTVDAEAQFAKLAFFREIEAQLRVIGGKVYIFDHLGGEIKPFEKDGAALDPVQMSYHKLPNRQRHIIVDDVRGEAYTAFEQHGFVRLCKINLEDGSLSSPVEVPMQFPHKLQVRDGMVYFLYREGHYDHIKRLYRMPF